MPHNYRNISTNEQSISINSTVTDWKSIEKQIYEHERNLLKKEGWKYYPYDILNPKQGYLFNKVTGGAVDYETLKLLRNTKLY